MTRNYRKEYDNYQGKPEQIVNRSSRNIFVANFWAPYEYVGGWLPPWGLMASFYMPVVELAQPYWVLFSS